MFQKNTLSVKNLTQALRVKVNPRLKLAEKNLMENALKNPPAKGGINYEALEQERSAAIQRNIQLKLANQMAEGRIDSLRRTVLHYVVRSDYEKAASELDRFIDFKDHFPTFRGRTTKHVQHCRELINAIRAKRNFPGLAALTISKQQEMLDHVLAHFDELKQVLKYIERIANECALDDLRSTSWLLRIVSYVVMIVTATAFMLDFTDTFGKSGVIVYNDAVDQLWKAILSLF